jgi:hypothetical protein
MSTNNQDFKSFREREKITRKRSEWIDEAKIVEEKQGRGELAKYFESISWVQRSSDKKKEWKSAIKIWFGRFGSTHSVSIDVDSMHGAQRRQESHYLDKREVQMLIKFLQEIEPDLQDVPADQIGAPGKLEKY